MYYLTKNIENVNYYYASENDLLLYSKNDELFINFSLFQIIGEKILGGYLSKKVLSVTTESKNYFYFNSGENLLFYTNHLCGLLFLETNFNIQLTRLENLHYAQYDIISNKVLKEYHTIFNGVYPSAYKYDCIFIHDFPNPIVKAVYLPTDEYLWETQLNRNGEIFKILGIRADELIVCWKRGNMDFGLLGINIHTGEIAWNMDDNDLLNGYTLNFSPDENALFCVKNSGFKSYYLELDLLTKKTLRFDEIPKFFELGLIIDRIWVKENLIYFFARKGSKFSTVAGIMDYKTLEILWQEQIVVGSWAYLSDLQVDNDMLYILDGEGVLHIFEREASVPSGSSARDPDGIGLNK